MLLKKNIEKTQKTERSSVSFEKGLSSHTNRISTAQSDDKMKGRKSKLYIAKNFVKSLFPFLRSMKNLKNDRELEKPSNKEIFYYSFRKFLRDDNSIDDLMYAKNFPNRYFKKNVDQFYNVSEFLSKHNSKSPEIKQITKLKTFSLAKNIQKNQSQKKFSTIWKAIKERIEYRKKIKNELQQINPYYLISTSDEKFFSNFYSITNNQIDKIRNKDLISSSTTKNFYNNDLKTLKLKEMLLKRPKNPVNSTTSGTYNSSLL